MCTSKRYTRHSLHNFDTECREQNVNVKIVRCERVCVSNCKTNRLIALFPPSKILLWLASASVMPNTRSVPTHFCHYYSVNYDLYDPLTSHVCLFLFRCKRLMSTTKLTLHAPLFHPFNHWRCQTMRTPNYFCSRAGELCSMLGRR